jgi:hypothetical protein
MEPVLAQAIPPFRVHTPTTCAFLLAVAAGVPVCEITISLNSQCGTNPSSLAVKVNTDLGHHHQCDGTFVRERIVPLRLECLIAKSTPNPSFVTVIVIVAASSLLVGKQSAHQYWWALQCS